MRAQAIGILGLVIILALALVIVVVGSVRDVANATTAVAAAPEVYVIESEGAVDGRRTYDGRLLALNSADRSYVSYYRLGSKELKHAWLMPPSLSLYKSATPSKDLHDNDPLTYTLTISAPGLSVHLWDPLPDSVRYVTDSLTSTVTPTAIYSPTAHAVMWRGALYTDTVQTIRFQVSPDITGTEPLSLAMPIVNTARLTDKESGWSVSTTSIVNGRHYYLPLILW